MERARRTGPAAVAALAAAAALAGCAPGQIRLVEKSMEPTIRSGEYVSIDYGAYDSSQPSPGDIVSFRAPAGEECGTDHDPRTPCPQSVDHAGIDSYVKRVVAGPYDRVAVRSGGRAVVNGEPLDEPYAILCAPKDSCDFPRSIVVPDGHVFVLGDNRPYSLDSRHFGPIPFSALEGEITPPDRD